uniref:Uncharacterized protein n=1 Tax=Tanacetum cinerariifolium TaxID=118510 RepID=A0A699JUX3_TANCI|nr:hypothetical protein [Tanacetum cinerariifolium]
MIATDLSFFDDFPVNNDWRFRGRVGKKIKSRALKLKKRLFKVRIESSAEKSLGDQEDASNQGRIDQDEGIAFVQEDTEIQGSAPITTAGVFVSTAEPSTPPTTTTIIEDEDLTIAQTLMKKRSEKSKEKEKEKERGSKENSSKIATRLTRGVIIREASEPTTRPIVPPQQKIDHKDKGKGKMAEP